MLRGNQFCGFHFRRQVPIVGYIVDFFCSKANVGVEADGGQHTDESGRRYDEERDEALAVVGVRMLRFSDVDILRSPDAVGEAILQALTRAKDSNPSARTMTPPPLPSPGVPGEGEESGAANTSARDDIIWSLLSSDLAQEVKAEFNARLAVGLDVIAATQHIFANFREALTDIHHGPVIILSLAALQMKEQQLHPIIRDAALELIQTGEAAAPFPASTKEGRGARLHLLDQFAVELQRSPLYESV
jgi:very-short-patch-repair endonuclease